MKRESLQLELIPVETEDDDNIIEEDDREEPKPRSKIYRVSARFGDQEWTVYRREDEISKIGLKNWVVKAKSKAESFIQPILESKGILSLLDPSSGQPPANGFILPEKTGILNCYAPSSKRWNPRYLVLSSGRIYCYRTEKSSWPSHVFDLVCFSIDQTKDHEISSLVQCSPGNIPSSTNNASFIARNNGLFTLTIRGTRYFFDAGTETSMRDWVISSRKSRDQMNANLNLTFTSIYKEINKDEVEDAVKQYKIEEEQGLSQVLLDYAQDEKKSDDQPRKKRANAFRQLRLSMVLTSRANGVRSKTDASIKGRRKVKVVVEKIQEEPSTETPRIEMSQTKINFEESDNSENIYFEEGKLKGATFNKIMQKLCQPDRDMDNFSITFLLTYPWFISSTALMGTLINWWYGVSDVFYEAIVKKVRERVANILIKWVEIQWNEFIRAKDLTTNLVKFLNKTASDSTMSPLQSAWLKNLIKYKCGKQTTETMLKEKTDPIIPQIFDTECFGMLDIHPLEIARQLTLVQSSLYNRLVIEEFIGQKWVKNPTETPNVINAIQRFNKISGWATEFVLQWRTSEQRGAILSKLIDIAYECMKLRNFETVVQIVSGLENAAVSRMKLSWAAVSEKSTEKLQELRNLFKPTENWKNYRVTLSASEIPTIPYLGLFLQSLIFTEDGNPDTLPNNLINWSKCLILSTTVNDILRFQQSQYPITHVPEISSLFTLENFVARNDRELFRISIEIEPKTVEKKETKPKIQIVNQTEKSSNVSFHTNTNTHAETNIQNSPPNPELHDHRKFLEKLKAKNKVVKNLISNATKKSQSSPNQSSKVIREEQEDHPTDEVNPRKQQIFKSFGNKVKKPNKRPQAADEQPKNVPQVQEDPLPKNE